MSDYDEREYLALRSKLESEILSLKELGEKLGFDEDAILSDIEDILGNVGFSRTEIIDCL